MSESRGITTLGDALRKRKGLDKSWIFGEYIASLGYALRYDTAEDKPVWYADNRREPDPEALEAWLRTRLAQDLGKTPMSDRSWRELVRHTAYGDSFNSHTDWLDGLPQPDRSRAIISVALTLPETFAADDTPLNRAWLPLVLLSMVHRIYEPGRHIYSMPTLLGKKGVGKSEFLQALVPFPSWYTETPKGYDYGQWAKALRGKLLTEHKRFPVSEGRAARLNTLIGSSSWQGRLPGYGRSELAEVPRAGVIVGTTSASKPLPPMGTNKRFVVLKCNRQWRNVTRWMDANREQLWAEAKALYLIGGKPYLSHGLSDEHKRNNTALAQPATRRWIGWS